MSVSDDLNEIDRILAEANRLSDAEFREAHAAALDLMPKVKSRSDLQKQWNTDERIQSGKRQIITSAAPVPVDFAAAAGFRMFRSAREMMDALRREVMLKMIRQAHEAELAEPGAPPASGIVGTPEW